MLSINLGTKNWVDGVEQGAQKTDMVEILSYTKMQITFNLEHLSTFNGLLLILLIIIKEGPYWLWSITIDIFNIPTTKEA